MQHLFDIHQWKWIASGWFLLYGISLFTILFCQRMHKKHMRLLAVAMLIILVILMNPILANFMIGHYMNNAKEFSRLGWGMLSTPIIAYVFTQFVMGVDCRKNQYVRLLAVVAMVYLLGSQVQPYFTLSSNPYKLPDEVLEVADAITDHASDEGDPYKQIGVLFPVDIGQGTSDCEQVFFGLRHWDATMILTETSLGQLQSGEQGALPFLLNDHEDVEEIEALGYKRIATTKSCDLYMHE